MRGYKKREFDIFGLILGVIIGCLIGFFLSGRLGINSTKDVFGDNIKEEQGIIYLLQVGRYSDPTSAKAMLEDLKKKDLIAIKVEEYLNQKVFYYIYGDISTSLEAIQKSKVKYDNAGFESTIRSKYMYDLSEIVSDNQTLYRFWNEAIDNLFNSLKNKEIIISEQYQINPENEEVFSYLMTLKGLKNENLKTKYRLEVYRVINEKLG